MIARALGLSIIAPRGCSSAPAAVFDSRHDRVLWLPASIIATNQLANDAANSGSLSDERLLEVVKEVHRDNFSVHGGRTLWYALHRKGEGVGRDQVARLMRVAGLRGVTRCKRSRPAPSMAPEARLQDLVRRAWFRDAPDLVSVADFTHVRTREGWMYVSFLGYLGARAESEELRGPNM